MIKTVSSREFNQDVSRIKRESKNDPVFITDRGQVAHVLLSIQHYEQLIAKDDSIIDLLSMPQAADIEFEPERLDKTMLKPEDFS